MFELLVDHVWQSTLFVIAAGLLTLAFRRHGAHVRYWIWFTASMKFLVPFALIAALGSQFAWRTALSPAEGDWRETIERLVQPMKAIRDGAHADYAIVSTGDTRSGIEASGNAASVLSQTALPNESNTNLGTLRERLPQLVLWIWMLGTITLAANWMRRWLALRTLVRDAQPTQIGLPQAAGLQIRMTRQSIEPGVVGILHPVLLLPRDIVEQLSSDELESVLVHERVHIERRDNLTALAHMLVQALFWWCPLVWWIGARLVAERERACDEAVLSADTDARTYANALMTACSVYLKAPLPCTAGVSGGPLTRRIRRIQANRPRSRLGRAGKLMLAASFSSALMAPLVAGLLTTGVAIAQEPSSDSEALLDESSLDEPTLRARIALLRAVSEFGTGSAPAQQAAEEYLQIATSSDRNPGIAEQGNERFQVLFAGPVDADELSRLAPTPIPFLTFDAELLDAYVGYFELEDNMRRDFVRILAIHRDGAFLIVEWNDQRLVLGAVTDTEFSNYRLNESGPLRTRTVAELLEEFGLDNVSSSDGSLVDVRSDGLLIDLRTVTDNTTPKMVIRFDPPDSDSSSNESSPAAHLSIPIGGDRFPAGRITRVDSQDAQRRLDEISQRFQSQSPAAGSISLLTEVAQRLSDDGDTDSLAAQSAQVIRSLFETRLPGLLEQRGDFAAVEHRETYRSGDGLFEIIFDNLAFTTVVGSDAGGDLRPLTFNLSCRPRSPMAQEQLGDCASERRTAAP